MDSHALLAPSSAGRWVPCPGSVKHEAKYPEQAEHPTTREGSAIHEVAAKVLQEFVEFGMKGHTFKRSDFIDTIASNGVAITAEMCDVAEMYIRDVMQVSTRFDGLTKVLVEHRVHMPSIHKDNWGTLDGAVMFLGGDELVISDLKAGWGIVEVWDNWQLIDYAIGLLDEFVQRNWPMPKVVELRLVQPRPSHRNGKIRVQRLSLQELGVHHDRLRASAEDAMGPNPTFNTGAHCDHCKGRHSCEALAHATYRVNTVIKGIQPTELVGAELGKHLDMLEEAETLVKALKSALSDKALIEIQQGRAVLGYSWAQKESRVNWTKPIEDVIALGELYGIETAKLEPITPKQAISAGVPESVVNTMSASKSAGITLAKADTRLASKVFKPTN